MMGGSSSPATWLPFDLSEQYQTFQTLRGTPRLCWRRARRFPRNVWEPARPNYAFDSMRGAGVRTSRDGQCASTSCSFVDPDDTTPQRLDLTARVSEGQRMSDGGGAPGGRAAFDGAQSQGLTRLRGWLARGVGLHLAVIAGLLLLSVVMWWRVWVTGHPTSAITCLCGDASGALADLAWAPWAVIHGHNPFFSNAIYAGQGGANMLANTTWIAGSLLFAPVTWLFGPIATLNVVMTLAPVASGWCCFLAVRQFTRFVPGQVVAAFLYGFSPLVVTSEPVGHFAEVWLVYPPLAFLCLYDLLVTKRHRPVPLGVGLGLLTVVQFFLSTEVLAISVLIGGIGLIV